MESGGCRWALATVESRTRDWSVGRRLKAYRALESGALGKGYKLERPQRIKRNSKFAFQ